MTVAVGTEVGAGSGLGTGTGMSAESGLGAGTNTRVSARSQLGAGTGIGTERATGAAAGSASRAGASLTRETGTGAGAEKSTGTGFAAAFERAGGGASIRAAAFAAGAGETQPSLHAMTGSATPIAGKECFKANWQSMLRALGVAEHPRDEAPEGRAEEPGETDAADKSSGGQASTDIEARAFVPRPAAQSTLTLSGRKGSTANAVTPVNGSKRANQPMTNGTSAMPIAQSATVWSAAKTTGGAGNSPAGSKTEKRQSTTPNAGGQGQAAQGINAITGSPVEAVAAAAHATTFNANTPSTNAIHSAAPSLPRTADVQDDGRAMIAEQPVSRAIDGAGRVIGAQPTAPAVATVNPVHAAQTPPSHLSMNSGGVAATETQDEASEESTAVPQSTMTAAVAAASAPEVAGAMHTKPTSGFNEQQTTVGGLLAHRGDGEASGAAHAAGAPQTDKSSLETRIENPQTLPAKTAQAAAAAANPATSQQNGSHVVAAQISAVETSAMVRDPAGAHGPAPSAPAGSGISAGTPAAAQETFSALDAGAAVGAPSWVHAGSRQAEAGFEDPALGWVGVRADLSGGSVHASLVPGSTGSRAGAERTSGWIGRIPLGEPYDGGDSDHGRSRSEPGAGHGAGNAAERGSARGTESGAGFADGIAAERGRFVFGNQRRGVCPRIRRDCVRA